MKKKIVTIGGGSGQYTLLTGLRDVKNIKIISVVSMVDSGGSTGRLRDELGVLPPGDILKCVLALSKNRDHARRILQHRFKAGNRLDGHSAGNLFLTILSQYAGNFHEGVKALSSLLESKGRVLPVTTNKATLVAELLDGSQLFGEAAIDVPKGKPRGRIKKAFLVPHHSSAIKVHPPVITAIRKADYIIIGPGDLYTSIIPNLIVPKVAEELKKTKAKLIYVANIMTKFGETDDFIGEDFVYKLERVIKRKFNMVIFNNAKPDNEVLREYKKQKAKFVEIHQNKIWNKRKVIKTDLLSLEGGLIRHDSQKLASIIKEIIA